MDVYSITDAGVEQRSAEELKVLLDQPDALIWVDMPICLANDAAVLSDIFGFHELAVRDCVERNHISKLHFYDDHVFTVLHAPEMGSGGHVHYVELDQFVGPNYLVTVHGPLNPAVDAEVAFADTRLVLRRIEQDEIHPSTPMELSYSIVSAMARRETDLVAALAKNPVGSNSRSPTKTTTTIRKCFWRSCSRSGTNCWPSAPWPPTAPRPTAEWPSGSGLSPIRKSRWSPILATYSTWSSAWPTASGSSCTV
jgi:hypothetical protein